MDLDEAREKLLAAEANLEGRPFVLWETFNRNGRPLHVAITERWVRLVRRARLWKSPQLLGVLKNADYGFDENKARSRGGSDGLFLLDRTFTPANSMMRKVFDQYLDRPGSRADDVAAGLGVTRDKLLGVRVVSHHLRLLGVLARKEHDDWLVLIDLDLRER